MKKPVASFIVIALSVSYPSNSFSKKLCFDGLRDALVRGHFRGPLICDDNFASFEYIGKTTRRGFLVYDYRYRFLPKTGKVMHGGQKIVLFRENRYVGQFTLSPPPYVKVFVQGDKVILEVVKSPKKVYFDLSVKPPREILVDGEIENFAP